MADELRAHGLSVTVILDASVGYIMEQIDVVMVGAEGVVENGGIINKVRFSSASILFYTMRCVLSISWVWFADWNVQHRTFRQSVE